MLIRNVVQPLRESIDHLVWGNGMTILMYLWVLAKRVRVQMLLRFGVCDKSGVECSSGNETIAGWRYVYSKSVQQGSPAKTGHG